MDSGGHERGSVLERERAELLWVWVELVSCVC
jgi:hypothetical protein